MKSLAVDLDSGKVSRWIGDPREFPAWSDKYGDLYTLNVVVYRSGGGAVPQTSVKLLVKKPRRKDVAAVWSLKSFDRVPTLNSPGVVAYEGQVSVSCDAYRTALKFDAAPGNDVPSVDYVAILQLSTPTHITEVEFDYIVVNSGYRLADVDFTGLYVGISEDNGLLVRNLDGPEWRELVVVNSGDEVTFQLGTPVLGPVNEITSLSDDYVRINNGILQIKNDNTGDWINVLLRGQNGSTISLGEDVGVGFTLSTNRYKVDLTTGRLLLRNLTTGNWHEARVTGTEENVLALGDEFTDE